MKRKDFVKNVVIGAVGAPTLIGQFSKTKAASEVDSCSIFPEETSGPYPLDLSSYATIYRSDITEGKDGLPLNLTITVVEASSCNPIENASVDVWYCDADGYYSG